MSVLRTSLTILAIIITLCTFGINSALAGPPYMTDDPDPVPYHHWEFYTFASGNKVDGFNTVQGPAIELNNGVAPNLQLHLVVPWTSYSPKWTFDAPNRYIFKGPTQTGLGDIEAGVKYRFLTETKARPEVGIFPLAELSTGESSKGLGNGKTWYKIPIWVQKSSGPWIADIGGGYAFNSAPGQLDYWYGGVLLQRTIDKRLSLGGELFFEGAQAQGQTNGPLNSPIPVYQVPGSRSTQIWNVGGVYNFTPDFSLLASAGHSYQGDSNSVFYVSLYRTWGPGAP
jgi:hypothetical protein